MTFRRLEGGGWSGNAKNQSVRLPNDRPPTYTSYYDPNAPYVSRRDPRNWSWRCWALLIASVVVVVIVAVVVAVLEVKANRYPDYSKLTYGLVDTYAGTSFFDNFYYFYGYDPAEGFVHYTDSEAAAASNLTYASSTSAILRVDTSDTDTTTGRLSARVQSKATYNTGLFIFDVLHSPYGCSTWPALWMSDPSNWPYNGEIDIMEANNAATVGNQMTLHTSEGCTMNVKRKEIASPLTTNCWNESDSDTGCGVRGPTATFGEEFNNNGGGVYATELRSAGIRTWFFARDAIPSDIVISSDASASGGSPDPTTWGEALADFPATDCDVSAHFKNQTIIANIDLCGQWAGLTEYYNTQSACPGTCIDYVSDQPGSAYAEAYWEFASWRVYQAT